MNSLSALSFVLGAGAGAGIALVVWFTLGRRPRSFDSKPVQRQHRGEESTVYFGRDDGDDHPHDIERAHAHRYDGMQDSPDTYVPSGLDCGRFPR